MKRNQLVVVVVVCALALMAWSGYQNLKRRRAAQEQPRAVLVPDASNQTVGQDVASDEGLPNLRGRKAPGFALKNLSGKKVSLADYKGRAVLINFWATWCAPCKIEMPWMVELRNQYAPQGFEILGVDQDDASSKAAVLKFAEKTGLTYPVLYGDDAISKAYGGVEFLPTSYYVGKDGKIVEETAGLASRDEIEANIKKALAAGGE